MIYSEFVCLVCSDLSTCVMDSVQTFLASPSEELLDCLTKENVRKVAEHFNIDLSVSKTCKVQDLRDYVKVKLEEKKVLCSVKGDDPITPVAPVTAPVTPQPSDRLTFEQHKELLLLQNELQSKERERQREFEGKENVSRG